MSKYSYTWAVEEFDGTRWRVKGSIRAEAQEGRRAGLIRTSDLHLDV